MAATTATWTEGYVADVAYTYGYYAELNPLRIQLAFLNAGLVPPASGTACELGFGQGMSVNLHAAASVTQWSGTDFNPAQAGFARELAQEAGSDARLFDEAFETFCRRGDLPDFDFIGLHGIWSWISDENRAVIVEFVRRKLKVGGVLYISYNTQPGWAPMVPMRELMNAHASTLGANGLGLVSRIDSALDFADRLLAASPAYAQANPQVTARLSHIKSQNRHYVAHEYFNQDWQPMSFGQLQGWLAPAKLEWACSANFMDAIDVVNLTTDQQQLLAEIPDAMLRQTVRDFCVNQQFRKDYWVKGARRLSVLDQREALQAHRVVLIQPRARVSLKVRGHLGEATLQEAVYQPILDQLADHMPHTLGELEAALAPQDISLSQVAQAAMVFSANGVLGSVLPDASVTACAEACRRLNLALMRKARSHEELSYLASPLTGGGIAVSRFHQLFLLAREQGADTARALADHLLALLDSQGIQLIKEGQALATEKARRKELENQARQFLDEHLSILQALGVAC